MWSEFARKSTVPAPFDRVVDTARFLRFFVITIFAKAAQILPKSAFATPEAAQGFSNELRGYGLMLGAAPDCHLFGLRDREEASSAAGRSNKLATWLREN